MRTQTQTQTQGIQPRVHKSSKTKWYCEYCALFTFYLWCYLVLFSFLCSIFIFLGFSMKCNTRLVGARHRPAPRCDYNSWLESKSLPVRCGCGYTMDGWLMQLEQKWREQSCNNRALWVQSCTQRARHLGELLILRVYPEKKSEECN